MRRSYFVAVLSTLMAAACDSGRPVAAGPATVFGGPTDGVFFSLERTPCFGTCPAYTVSIMADGTAYYVGRSNAPREGSFTGRVDRSTMQALLDRADSIGFFDYADKYDGQVTDIPSTIIRVHANGKDKRVLGRMRTPPDFKPFAAYADALLERVEWSDGHPEE